MKIVRVIGIDITIHWSFWFLPAVVALTSASGSDLACRLLALAAVYPCVVLHELGHSIAAKYYGITAKKIMLLPIGAAAIMNDIPRAPLKEIVISMAGPLVNLIILLPIAPFVWGTMTTTKIEDMSLIQLVFLVNVVMMIFNLMPVFPLDGGRILRATLSLLVSRRKANNIALVMAAIFSFFFFGIGLASGNLILVAIAIFVIFQSREISSEDQRHTLQEKGIAAKEAHLRVRTAHLFGFEVSDRDIRAIQDFNEALYEAEEKGLITGGKPIPAP